MREVLLYVAALAGLLTLIFALVIAQAAAARIPSGEYRYHDGAWFLQRTHQVVKVQQRQYRYHEGEWIYVNPLNRSNVVAIKQAVIRPDDRAGVRGIG